MANYKNIVLKIGSALLTDVSHDVDEFIKNVCKQIAKAKKNGVNFTIVTSGAISKGQEVLNVSERPNDLDFLQALAAIGQQSLMRMYEKHFNDLDCLTAQVLLTHDDMNSPNRFLNAKATISRILKLGGVPIINENDVVATEEIRLGDNDTLAAMVSNLIDADLLIILTNQDGLYNKNPDKNHDAKLIKKCNVKNLVEEDYDITEKSKFGTGGFKTKLNAVKMVTSQGTKSVIASGFKQNVIENILGNKNVGTIFFSE